MEEEGIWSSGPEVIPIVPRFELCQVCGQEGPGLLLESLTLGKNARKSPR